MIRLNDIHINNRLVRLWLLLVVAGVGSLADIAEFAVRSVDSAEMLRIVLTLVALFCVAVFKATILTAVYGICRKNKWFKALAMALIMLFIMLSLINGICWLFYGFGLSMKLFTIIVETNPVEVREFLPELGAKLIALVASPWLWIIIVVFVAAYIGLPLINYKWLAMVTIIISGFGLMYLVIVVLPAEFGRVNHSVFARAGRCVTKYIGDRRRIRELEALKRPLLYTESLVSKYAANRVVVVIGESASRDHLSLYGYRLPTTPRLDSIRENLFIFDDAVASSTSTAENIPRLLTFMTDNPGEKEWYEYPSLLQLFRNLGYRTYWLSNQEHSGRWSNLSSILSADADVLKYVGSMDSEDHYLYRYDDALLPEWNNVIDANDSLQLVFLHLMGSHFQYERRFPASRHHFSGEDIISLMPRKWLNGKKAEVVANYDNSILFTDSIISYIIDDLMVNDAPSILIYVSDHGENVYDDRDYRGRDPKFVDVPFIIYANDAFIERNPDIINDVELSLSNPFSTSEIPQMLLHLTGTRYQLYDSIQDPLSPGFKFRKRWVDEKIYYKDGY